MAFHNFFIPNPTNGYTTHKRGTVFRVDIVSFFPLKWKWENAVQMKGTAISKTDLRDLIEAPLLYKVYN